jgi:hypothetical protein
MFQEGYGAGRDTIENQDAKRKSGRLSRTKKSYKEIFAAIIFQLVQKAFLVRDSTVLIFYI